jgi:hypothetical protein
LIQDNETDYGNKKYRKEETIALLKIGRSGKIRAAPQSRGKGISTNGN